MDAADRIRAILREHPAVLFMKGTPEFPMCEYSERAAAALAQTRAAFHAVNVLADPEVRAALPAFANWPTFPQLFLHGELIGGCDIITDLLAAGELTRMVTETAAVPDTAAGTQK